VPPLVPLPVVCHCHVAALPEELGTVGIFAAPALAYSTHASHAALCLLCRSCCPRCPRSAPVRSLERLWPQLSRQPGAPMSGSCATRSEPAWKVALAVLASVGGLLASLPGGSRQALARAACPLAASHLTASSPIFSPAKALPRAPLLPPRPLHAAPTTSWLFSRAWCRVTEMPRQPSTAPHLMHGIGMPLVAGSAVTLSCCRQVQR